MSDAMNPYPAASEAVDGHLSSAIDGLRGDMRTSFDRVERRLDNMVTQDAFKSEVTRLDQADKHLDDKMKEGFSALKTQVEDGFKSVEARDVQRDKTGKQRITWLLVLAGLISGVVFGVLNLLIN